MDKKYLLTYQNSKCSATFSWFDTEEEMNEFIEENKDIHVLDALYIPSAEVLG